MNVHRASVMLPVLMVLASCAHGDWRVDDPAPLGPRESQVPQRVLAAFAAEQCPARDRLGSDFASDGCSLWPDRGVAGCCVAHDLAYWCGGSAMARRRADQALRDCAGDAGHPVLGRLMYWGVRLGGHPAWPFPWRWGFGRRWRASHWSEPEIPLEFEPPGARGHQPSSPP